MKPRRPASFVLIALLASSGVAAAGPKIYCKASEFQFGDRPTTGAVEHIFIIENTGDSPLQIAKIRACCGAAASIDSQLIAPGSNGNLKAILYMDGRRGEQKKSFYVASNDPNQPYYQIRMFGNGVAEAYVEPGNLDFGDVRRTNDATRIVRLVCSSNIALSVTSVAVDSPAFTARSEKTAEGYSIQVTISLPLKPGVTQGNVRILTDNKTYPKFDVHLVATLGCDIMVVPHEITLVGTNGKAEPVTRYMAVRSKLGIPFKIIEVDPPEPGIEVKVAPLSSGGYRVEVKNILSFPELDGKQFVIRTDHEDGREIPIPIRMTPATGKGN